MTHDHSMHTPPPAKHVEHIHMEHTEHGEPAAGGMDHSAHTDHTGHEDMFRQRFWVCLLLSIPVLLYSASVQRWLSFSMPEFPGSTWIFPLFAVIVFWYGGLPFLQMARPEIKNRRPGMMTLISMAISVAFVYSVLAVLLKLGEDFFWELVTLIDVMLLGHWL